MSIVRSGRASWAGETARLAVVPLFISLVMLWPALLGMGVLAPTDIVAADPLIGGRSPTSPIPQVQNPILGDVVDVFIPWKLYARSELWQGRFPLWNPYNGLGTHFHASLQSQVLSPFNLLWMLLPPLWGLGAITALKWTLCGLGMGLLLRALGLGMIPAVFGSAALQLSGPVLGWLQWPISEGLAWVPWMLWAALKWIDTLDVRWLAAFSAFVAAELLAGHIETAFHSLAFLAVFSIAGLVSNGQFRIHRRDAETQSSMNSVNGKYNGGNRRYLLKALAGLLGAGLIGLGISVVQLLPFLDVLTSSFQWMVREGAQVKYISMPPAAALMWLSPNGFGWPDAYRGPSNWVEANPYVGAVTLLLAAWAIAKSILSICIQGEKSTPFESALSPRKPFSWLGLFVIATGMAYGIPPLSFLRELPGFNSSFNSRLISVAGPCVIVLGAMGLDHLLTLPRCILRRTWGVLAPIFGAIGLLFLLTGAQIWFVKSTNPNSYIPAWIAWAGVLFSAGALLILARLLGWLRPGAFGLLVIGLLLLDMMRAGWGFNPASPRETFYPTNSLTRFLAKLGPDQRVAIVGKYADSNMLLALRVPDYRLYDPMESSRYVAFSRLLTPETFRTAFREQDPHYTTHMVLVKPSAVHMAVVGIRWLVTDATDDPNSWQPVPSTGTIYKQVRADNGFAVWENLYALPLISFAQRLQVAPDEAISLRRTRALTIDRVNQAHIEAAGGELTIPVASLDTGEPVTQSEVDSLKLARSDPGLIEVKATAERYRFLVVNEGWADGWRAELDGATAQIYRVNYVVQGVVVPVGEHTIRLIYDPSAFRWGVGISLASLVGWLGLVVFIIAFYLPQRR